MGEAVGSSVADSSTSNSALSRWTALPQGLKPAVMVGANVRAEARTLQNLKPVPFKT